MDKTIYSAEQVVFSELLRELRATGRLRQQDVAHRLGEPQSFVSKYESGERRLDIIELRQVAAALGTTTVELVLEFERRLAGAGDTYEQLVALESSEPAGPVDNDS